jgi:hypothetical protein
MFSYPKTELELSEYLHQKGEQIVNSLDRKFRA